MILQRNKGLQRVLEVRGCPAGGYEEKMLRCNRMKYFPRFASEQIDGETRLYFRIDGMSTLSELFSHRSPNRKDVEKLMTDLRGAVSEMQEYMLLPESLVLGMQYTVYDSREKHFRFLYLPREKGEFGRQLKSLLEEIMVLYDHADREGNAWLYDFYSEILVDNFSADYFCRLMDQRSAAGEGRVSLQAEILNPDQNQDDSLGKDAVPAASSGRRLEKPEMMQPEPEKAVSDRFRIILPGAGVLILGVVLILLKGTRGIRFLILAAACYAAWLFYCLLKKQASGKDEPPEDVVEWQESIPRGSLSQQQREFLPAVPAGRPVEVTKLVPREAGSREPVALPEGTVRIGRQRELCDFWLPETGVSRIHALIERHGGTVTVCDMGSTNGTYLNHVRLEKDIPASAGYGDVLSLAGVEFYCL